jgi:S1-C subfamily serine protease
VTYQARHGTWTRSGTVAADATIREAAAGLGRYEYAIAADEHVTVLVGFDLTPTVRSVVRDVRLPRANAVRVTGFSGPANARDAGLRIGDVLLRHGAERVENLRALRAAIGSTKPADTVRLEGLRDGAAFTWTAAGGRLGITAENVRVEDR